MKNKHVGFLIMGVAILFFFIVMSFNNALETIVRTSCTHGVSCPMEITLKTQKTISYSLIGVLMAVGAIISFFMKDIEKVLHYPTMYHKDNSKEEREKKIEKLDGAEKAIMNIVIRENGSVYQSDIIKETKRSKVQVSRVLDKLEGKGLIERKRRGMTNIIILK